MAINLTEKIVERARPDQAAPRRIVLYDAATPGLALRVETSGVKTFYFVARIGKRQRWIKIATYAPGLRGDDQPGTLTHARRQIPGLRDDIIAGVNVADARIDARHRLRVEAQTFGELSAAWITAARTGVGRVAMGRKKLGVRKTWAADQARIDLDFSDWKKRRLTSLTAAVVEKRIAEIAERSPTTANRCVSLLTSIFHLAVTGKLMPSNPASGIARSKERPRERYLDDEGSARLLLALDDEKDPRWKAYWTIALLLVCRRGELCRLTWSNVRGLDGPTPSISFPGSTTKSGEPKVLPLPGIAADALRALARDERYGRLVSPFVFNSSRAKSGHLLWTRKAWFRLLDAAGIDHDIRAHDLRRGLTSSFAASGVAAVVAQHVLGHSTSAMTTRVYTVVGDATRRAALDAYAERLQVEKTALAAKITPLHAAQ